jgi:hypothetical protein
VIGDSLYSVSGLRALVHTASRVAHAALHLARTLEREFVGIEHRVKVIEREIGAGIGNDVRTSVDHLLKWEKAAKAQLKADAQAIGRAVPVDLADAERFLGIKPGIKWLEWATGIVAGVFSLEAINLLRCTFLRNLWNNRGCGLWQGLEDILGLLFDAVLFADLCNMLPELVSLFGDFEAPLVDLIASAADAACAHPPQGWVELSAPPLSLPTVYYTGPVPGN